jgi:hypothetical protein
MASRAQRQKMERLGPWVKRQFMNVSPWPRSTPLHSLTMHHAGCGGWRSKSESTGVVSATQAYTGQQS